MVQAGSTHLEAHASTRWQDVKAVFLEFWATKLCDVVSVCKVVPFVLEVKCLSE